MSRLPKFATPKNVVERDALIFDACMELKAQWIALGKPTYVSKPDPEIAALASHHGVDLGWFQQAWILYWKKRGN